MSDMFGVIQLGLKGAAFWCALFTLVSNSPRAMARSQPTETQASGAKLAFLSRPKDDAPPPAEAAPFSTFTSGGCPYTGSLPARIVGGKIIIRGGSGQVDPDGTLHSVGAGNGMTLTAVGQLLGNTGSGTFNRSDGCVGHWIAIKRETLGRHR